jgi:hypothetical protein
MGERPDDLLPGLQLSPAKGTRQGRAGISGRKRHLHTLPEKQGGGGAEDVPGLPGIHEAIQRAKEKPLTSAHANGPKKSFPMRKYIKEERRMQIWISISTFASR